MKREGFLRLRCFSSPRHEATTSLLLFQAVISLPPFSSTFDLYRSEHKSLCSSLLKRLLIFFLPFEKSGQLNSFSFGSGFPLQLLANEKKCNVSVFFWIAFLQLLFFLTKITLLYWDSSTRLLLSLSPLVIIVILYLYCKMERELLANGSKTALLFLVSMERSYPKG